MIGEIDSMPGGPRPPDSGSGGDAHAHSDVRVAFRAIVGEVERHEPTITGFGRQAAQHPEIRYVDIVLGNLKTAI